MEHTQNFPDYVNHLIMPFKPLIVTLGTLYLTDINTVLGTIGVCASLGYTIFCWFHKNKEINKNKNNGNNGV